MSKSNAVTIETPLGLKIRDRVTGLEGIGIAKTQWLNGCVRFTIQPALDKDNKVPDAHTFDAQQLEVVGRGIEPEDESEAESEKPRKTTGGPYPEPTRNRDPR